MTEQDPMIGRVVLGRYRIVRALAKGGMGVVYLARTEGASGFSKPFVVKRMATDILVDTNMLKMFVREARVMSRMRHPGLVGVTDFGEEGGDYLMVLEYVHGFHLGQWHRYHRQTVGPFPAEIVLHIMCKVLDGLDYAHNLAGPDGKPLEIVHRDVSPSNILIDVEGIVKLADFGVARSEEHTEKTEETTIKGKMPYLAPELFRLARPTPSTDAYAAAVVLHEILVGRNEFRTGDMASTVSRVLEHDPTDIGQVRADVPVGLASVLRRALHKNPEKRYRNAAELANALRTVRQTPEEDLDKQLRELAQRDFLSPAMGQLLGVVSLAERDEAWRNAPIPSERPVADSDSPPTVRGTRVPSLPPPEIGLDPFLGAPHSKPKSRLWPIVGGLFLFGIAAGGVAFAIVTAMQQQQPPVIVTVGQVDAGSEAALQTDAAPNVESPEDAGSDAGEAAEDAAQGANEKRPPTKQPPTKQQRISTGEELARPIRRRQQEIIGCFQAQPGDRVTLSIRFSINTEGSVTNASIRGTGASAGIGQTPAGQCVLRIARSTVFQKQPRPITFSIPFSIQAR